MSFPKVEIAHRNVTPERKVALENNTDPSLHYPEEMLTGS